MGIKELMVKKNLVWKNIGFKNVFGPKKLWDYGFRPKQKVSENSQHNTLASYLFGAYYKMFPKLNEDKVCSVQLGKSLNLS